MSEYYSKEKAFQAWWLFPNVLRGPEGLYSWYGRRPITRQDVETKAGISYKEDILAAAVFLQSLGPEQQSKYVNYDGDIVSRTLSPQEIAAHSRFAYALFEYCNSPEPSYDSYFKVARAVDPINYPLEAEFGAKRLADYDTARFLAGLVMGTE